MASDSIKKGFLDDDQESFESESSKSSESPVSASKKRSGLSLKARAVSYLSRREHTRVELARKLKPHAESEDEIERVLDALAREGWQSDQRFVQSVIHSKSPSQGSLRIVHALRQQGVSDSQIAEAREKLKNTELERAQAVWLKKFGNKVTDEKKDYSSQSLEYAKQARFLAARGFSHDVIHKVLKDIQIDEDL